jgi:hypothetical protein
MEKKHGFNPNDSKVIPWTGNRLPGTGCDGWAWNFYISRLSHLTRVLMCNSPHQSKNMFPGCYKLYLLFISHPALQVSVFSRLAIQHYSIHNSPNPLEIANHPRGISWTTMMNHNDERRGEICCLGSVNPMVQFKLMNVDVPSGYD